MPWTTEIIETPRVRLRAFRDDDTPTIVAQAANEPSLRLLSRSGFVAEVEIEEYGALQSQLRLARPASNPI